MSATRAPLRRPFANQKEKDEAIKKQLEADLTTNNNNNNSKSKKDEEKPVVVGEEDEDEEQRELAKLKCTSLPTEEIVDRERARLEREQRRKQNRMSSDYPGLAFGSAGMFGGSDTMMRFTMIKNELHNIMRSQLRRVDGEMAAMAERVKRMDDNLELSERHIREATAALAEAATDEMERRREEEGGDGDDMDALSRFDAQLRLLEGKLVQAKALAEETKRTSEEDIK